MLNLRSLRVNDVPRRLHWLRSRHSTTLYWPAWDEDEERRPEFWNLDGARFFARVAEELDSSSLEASLGGRWSRAQTVEGNGRRECGRLGGRSRQCSAPLRSCGGDRKLLERVVPQQRGDWFQRQSQAASNAHVLQRAPGIAAFGPDLHETGFQPHSAPPGVPALADRAGAS